MILLTWLVFMYSAASVGSLPTVVTLQGDINKTFTVIVNKTTEYNIYYEPFTASFPIRIIVSSENANVEDPVLVVVRQEKAVMSWEIPLLVETSTNQKKYYNVTSRTICDSKMDEINTPKFRFSDQKKSTFFHQGFTIAIASFCSENTKVFVETIQEDKFFVTDGKNTSLMISPSQSRYVFYKFHGDDTETVNIEIASNDDICLMVSIQDSYCPVFDLNENIMFKGRYQTILRKGGLTIKRKDFSEGFFLVFVAESDNYDCTQEHSIYPVTRLYFERNSDIASNVTFVVKGSLNRQEYMNATIITMVAIVFFYAIGITLMVVFRKYGAIKDIEMSFTDALVSRDLTDDTLPRSSMDIIYVLEKNDLNVKILTKYPLKDKKRSFNYLWHIISIAIFYSIPVVQLVITYQRMVNFTGNEDLCYYNFLCAHPLFGFNDFNHIFSNVGYLFMGMLFLITTLHRQTVVPFRFEVGIPVHYGLFYAMGVALIIEGLLSACYHICPSQSNYQFDTSFMYVMAVLCMIKLYQNRHPDLNATAYATFSVLGFGIFMASLGILHGSLSVWLIFVFGYAILCFYISFKIYFMSFVLEGFYKFKNELTKNGCVKETFEPVKKARFIILAVANVGNIGMLIVGLYLYFHRETDFGTFLLGLLMANAVLHVVFYTSMKILNKERICMEAIVYCVLAIVSWIFATMFFLDAATLWTVTPAESRQWNQECIFMDYYDKHDIWHLLSAPALYFTFMFLMCLDDDIIDKKQDEIPVF